MRDDEEGEGDDRNDNVVSCGNDKNRMRPTSQSINEITNLLPKRSHLLLSFVAKTQLKEVAVHAAQPDVLL